MRPHPPIYTAQIWKTQDFDLASRSLIVNESNQKNVKMMEKLQVSTSSRTFGIYGLAPENFHKQPSLKCQKMPSCKVGNHVCIIDFHPGMENMILPSNLYCTNLKKLKTLIFHEESCNERV